MKRPIFLFGLLFLLSLTCVQAETLPVVEAVAEGVEAAKSSAPEIVVKDLEQFVRRLASEQYEGRGTGDPGEVRATAYLASFFEALGLEPEGDEGDFFQEFPIDLGLELAGENRLGWPGADLKVEEDFLPLSISANAEIENGEAVFVGFGIETDEYNSFEGVDLNGKWMVVLRGVPEKLNNRLRQIGTLVAKAKVAKEKGAAGIIFVKAANPGVDAEMIPPSVNVGSKERAIPALNLSDRAARQLLTPDDELSELFAAYRSGERVAGFALEQPISAKISLRPVEASGRNVLGRLVAGAEPSNEVIMIGGHIDHLGYGNRGGTLAKGEAAKQIHFGADDNASGIAAIMEIAQQFAILKMEGRLDLDRDLVFAGWSGEEMGLIGSRHFIQAESEKRGVEKLYPAISAYVNLDMVGRLGDQPLKVQGTGSSPGWGAVLDELAERHDLETKRSPSPFLPTDATPFYQAGVPVLAAFTGLHPDYHRPSDTAEKIDYEGLRRLTAYLADLIQVLANRTETLAYAEFVRPDPQPRLSLGIAFEPDQTAAGLKITRVVDGSPADQAGIETGDVLLQLNGNDLGDRDKLFRAIGELKAGDAYPIRVSRSGEPVDLTIKPVARRNPRSGD